MVSVIGDPVLFLHINALIASAIALLLPDLHCWGVSPVRGIVPVPAGPLALREVSIPDTHPVFLERNRREPENGAVAEFARSPLIRERS